MIRADRLRYLLLEALNRDWNGIPFRQPSLDLRRVRATRAMRIRRVDAAGGELMNNKIRRRPIHVTFSGGEYKGSMLDNVNVIQTSNTPELGPVMRLAGGL